MKKSFIRLVIDSATKFLYIGLLDDNNELFSYYKEGNNDHSVNLMVQIEKALNEQNIQVSDIDEIIIGIGPGSYTGLRIGVVVAKMFGWNNNIPVKTVSSLALLATSYDGESLVLAEIDARRGNSFLGLYKNNKGSIELVETEQLTNLVDYQKTINGRFVTISEGKPQISKIIKSNLLTSVTDIHSLSPNYLRITEAERNLL